MSIILVALLGALGRRMAGGVFQQWTGINLGDLPVRIFFGLTLAFAAWSGGALPAFVVHGFVIQDWMQAIVIAVLGWAGTTIPMGGIDLGKNGGKVATSLAGLLEHGVGGGALIGLAAIGGGYAWPIVWLAGATMPALYWLGWVIAGERGAQWMPLGLRGGSEIGEATWGAVFAVGVRLAFAVHI